MNSNANKDALARIILDKYRSDPDGLRSYLPEIVQLLDTSSKTVRPLRHPFGLTERERADRQHALANVVDGMKHGSLTQEEAIRGLEHCAVLIEDYSLPPDVDHDTLTQLLRCAIGKAIGSIKRITTFPVETDKEAKVVNHIPLVRGVTLDLTWDMRLVSIVINPHKIRERRNALRFVGIAQNEPTDVARRHDDYLAAAIEEHRAAS